MNGRPRAGGTFAALVRSDLERFAAAELRPVTRGLALRMIFLVPGFQFVLARRIQDVLYALPLGGRLLGRVWWWRTCRAFGSEIAIGTPIGPGLYVPHPYGIVIGIGIVGANVTVQQNVTIGRRRLGDLGEPVIGDGAYLGAGAVIIGDVTIGRNARIGANTVVTSDVPDNAVAVGGRARILERKPDSTAPSMIAPVEGQTCAS